MNRVIRRLPAMPVRAAISGSQAIRIRRSPPSRAYVEWRYLLRIPLTAVGDSMRYVGVRAGVFAVLNGRECEGRPVREDGTVLVMCTADENPDPSRLEWNERMGQWRARLLTTELDRLYQAVVYARYEGRPVNITQIDAAGSATVYSTESQSGFTQIDRGVWAREAPVWDLRDVHEVQIDLLFGRWRQANFVKPKTKIHTAVEDGMMGGRPRTGLFATVNGRECRAEFDPQSRHLVTLVSDGRQNPDPALFQRDRQSGGWRAQVRVEQCERLDEVTTRASHLGHECEVVAIDSDGSVRLHYHGQDRTKAARDGFIQTEPGPMARTVNIYELGRLWEHHTDLLFSLYYRSAAK
jgi:hypothetical protein